MKKNAIKELSAKSLPELRKELEKTHSEIRKITVDIRIGKVKNVNLISEKKGKIARLKTFISQKEHTAK